MCGELGEGRKALPFNFVKIMQEETLESKIRGIGGASILSSKIMLATLRTDNEWHENVLSEMVEGITQYTRLAGSDLQNHIAQTLENYYEYDK